MLRTVFSAMAFLAISGAVWAQDAPQAKVGKPAIDFEMTNIDGKQLKLSEKIGKDKHIILMFSRANW